MFKLNLDDYDECQQFYGRVKAVATYLSFVDFPSIDIVTGMLGFEGEKEEENEPIRADE